MELDDSQSPRRNSAEPPHRALMETAERHPDESLFEILERVGSQGWRTEQFPASKQALFKKMNGLAALRSIQARLDGFEREFRVNAAPRRPQWLDTGEHLHVPRVLPAGFVSHLRSFCDEVMSEAGAPPVSVVDHPSLLTRLDLRSVARAIVAALPAPLPPSVQPVILKKRTLLRRTFPPNRLKPGYANSNNQLWHQDSNVAFNDRPMLTLWIPLHDTADGTRPGLQISNARAAHFSPRHGDYSKEFADDMQQLFPEAKVSIVHAAPGDCILFNGLTFHQTYAPPTVTGHRDVLLIRILNSADARDFSPNEPDVDVLPL